MSKLTLFAMVLMFGAAVFLAKDGQEAVGIIIAIEAGTWAIADTIGKTKQGS